MADSDFTEFLDRTRPMSRSETARLHLSDARTPFRELRAMSLAWWSASPPRRRTAIQLLIFSIAVIGAYNYTLVTLLQNVGLETPIAYVSLVPFISIGVAILMGRVRVEEPPIHDRQIDYIVGVPMIALAMLINLLLPQKLSVMFWVDRIDLLSLPIFVAGTVSIIFGVRVLWRQRIAVGFLFLAWPAPYSSVLLGVLNGFTSATISLLNGIVHVIPVATISGGGIYTVTHNGTPFVLSVISACSGVDSVVGFLLVGGCFSLIVKGRFLNKIAWLGLGMALVWGFNLFRLTFIFWAGHEWGQGVALGVFHPFIGLFLFAVAIGVMMTCMRLFRLSLVVPSAVPSLPVKRTIAVPKLHAAALLVLIVAGILGSVDAGLSTYNLVATSSGEPTLTSFDVNPNLAPVNFYRRYVTQINWATPYFGEGSTWKRYVYTDEEAAAAKSPISISEPIWADVVDSKDIQSFSAYGIEACYQFHGYTLSNISNVNLGGGIKGQILSYQTGTAAGSWSIVYWIVPVTTFGNVSYERVVLYVQDNSNVAAVAPDTVSGVSSLSGDLGSTTPQTRALVSNRNFLVLFARTLIQLQAHTKAPVLAAASGSAA